MSTSVEQIKDRLHVADVVATYLQLERSGRNYRARCPFHNERTPSFFVSPERESFYCFGCGKGGDIFTFIQEIEGVDFSGALTELADRAGVVLERQSTGERDERERLRTCLERAAQYFVNRRENHPEVTQYLRERGISEESIAEFRIGFAPRTWHSLSKFLSGEGIRDRDIEKSGLALSGRYGLYDRFRGRIMFPIADSTGRIVAFSGRVFGEAPDGVGKYINSPETDVYTKSRILYGLDRAKSAIRKSGCAILVEGQMDVIAAHQAGTKNTVAASGTALTDEHLNRLEHLAETLVVAFDGDDAGIRAALKSAGAAIARGFDVKLARLPAGEDPGDVALARPEEWKKLLDDATHAVLFYLAVLSERCGDDVERFRHEASRRVVPFIARMPNAVDRAHFASVVAKQLAIPEDSVYEELERARSSAKEKSGNRPQKPDASGGTSDTSGGQERTPRRTALERHSVGIIEWQRTCSEPRISVSEAEERFKNITGESVAERFQALSDDEQNRAVFAAEQHYGNVPAEKRHDTASLADVLEQLFAEIEELSLREQRAGVERSLAAAESAHDEARAAELLQQYHDLSRRIDALVGARTKQS